MSPATLSTLPPELILQTLDILSSSEVLPLAVVSRRFHALTTRLLHARLVRVTCLDTDQLIFECYHPSQKLTEPPLHGNFTGTRPSIESIVDHDSRVAVGKLQALRRSYCTFQLRRSERVGRRGRQIPGDIPGSRTYAGPSSPNNTVAENSAFSEEQVKAEDLDFVTQTLSLEGHELFIQLVAVTSLIQIWPGVAHLRRFVEVQDHVVRVWRDWLGKRVANDSEYAHEQQIYEVAESSLGTGAHASLNSAEKKEVNIDVENDEHILWIDSDKSVGLRVRVKEKKWRRDRPVLICMDEEIAVSFEVVYEELLVRTSHLLFVLEKTAQEMEANTGKAVVFGSFG